MNIHNMSTGVVTSQTFTQRLVKMICQQYDFGMGTKRRALFCLSGAELSYRSGASCRGSWVIRVPYIPSDPVSEVHRLHQCLRIAPLCCLWPKAKTQCVLHTEQFYSQQSWCCGSGQESQSHQFGFTLNSGAKQQVWQKHWRLHWRTLILRALLGWCYHPFIIHILLHIHGMTSKQVYTCHLPGPCAAMSVFWMIPLSDKSR